MPAEFQLVAGNLALDFANTLDYRFGLKARVELLPGFERLVAFARQAGTISGHQANRLLSQTSAAEGRRVHRRAIELREALDPLFRSVATGHPPRQTDLDTLNRFVGDAYAPDVIVRKQRAFTREARDLSLTPDGPLLPVIEAAVGLLTSSDLTYVRECEVRKCRWLFLDRSKNHSRRWCDMKICGNRTKARRFQARLRKEKRNLS